MFTQRLWHYVAVIFIVVGLIGLSIKHIFVDDTKWQQISGQALHLKMQTGLAQIYWQWQKTGRPNQIMYKPENIDEISPIVIDKQGRPEIEQSEQGCKDMLSWFVDQRVLNYQVKVSINKDNNSIGSSKQFSCKFEYAKYVYLYNTSTRQLDFTDAE